MQSNPKTCNLNCYTARLDQELDLIKDVTLRDGPGALIEKGGVNIHLFTFCPTKISFGISLTE